MQPGNEQLDAKIQTHTKKNAGRGLIILKKPNNLNRKTKKGIN